VGYRYFLLEAGPGERAEVESSLARMLEKLGVETETTWGRIAAYKAVENTYMAAFSILGGLGLALGTLGLGAVLARNVLERRGELGLLRAIGFSRADSVRLVSLENLLLLVAGLALGGGCALIAVLPTLLGTAEPVSWAGLGITMGAVVVAGLVAVCLAARTSLGGSLVAALRSE
jgi:ABC-type antimicrobial peptide transport system permease subunit